MSSSFSEELEALEAIYAEDGFTHEVKEDEGGLLLEIHIGKKKKALLRIPRNYPEAKPQSSNAHVSEIIEENWSLGCECLFQVVEGLRDRVDLHLEETEMEAETAEFATVFDMQIEEDGALEDANIQINKGPIVEVNKSKFQAFVARVSSMEEVETFQSTVVSTKACSRATHNIMCYRFYDSTTGILNHDYDDDGESAAGGRMAEMVRLSNVVDNEETKGIAVIVSRWYGGILLGPDRFKIISSTARNLLEDLGYLKSNAKRKKKGKK